MANLAAGVGSIFRFTNAHRLQIRLGCRLLEHALGVALSDAIALNAHQLLAEQWVYLSSGNFRAKRVPEAVRIHILYRERSLPPFSPFYATLACPIPIAVFRPNPEKKAKWGLGSFW